MLVSWCSSAGFVVLWFWLDCVLLLAEKWLWAVLYQLCKWETATNLYWADSEGRAGNYCVMIAFSNSATSIVPSLLTSTVCWVDGATKRVLLNLGSILLGIMQIHCLKMYFSLFTFMLFSFAHFISGRVRSGGYQVDSHWVLQQQDCLRPHWK